MIAKKAEKEKHASYGQSRFDVYRGLYRDTGLVGPTMDPATVFNTSAPPSLDTFPLFVTFYLRPKDWPKVITEDQARDSNVRPILVKQIPGQNEYHMLLRMLHPDHGAHIPKTTLTARGRGRGAIRRGGRIHWAQQTEDLDPGLNAIGLQTGNRDSDFVVEPSEGLGALLVAGYDLWKDTILSPVLKNECFVSLRDDAQQFTSKSPRHAQLMTLFNTWVAVSCNVMNSIIPTGRSVVQLHHFVNTLPRVAPDSSESGSDDDDDDDDDDNDDDEEEEDQIDKMPDYQILERASTLPQKRKRGRPRRKSRNTHKDKDGDEDGDRDGE